MKVKRTISTLVQEISEIKSEIVEERIVIA